MNIFELLTVIVVITAGYFGGKFLGVRYGLLGWIGGAFFGSLIAVLLYCAFRRLIGVPKNRD